MELATMEMEQAEAKEAYEAYRGAVKKRHDAEDAAIARAYKYLAEGKARQLIRLSECIAIGGTMEVEWTSRWSDERHTATFPRTAITRADAQWCYSRGIDGDGGVVFYGKDPWNMSDRNRRDRVVIPDGTFNEQTGKRPSNAMRAMAPIVPPLLRPPHALGNYHMLWEVDEWSTAPQPPGDPALLKHLGGDLYAVLAVWDLTDIERAVLAGRTTGS